MKKAANALLLLQLWMLRLVLSSASSTEDVIALQDFATKIGLPAGYWNFSSEPCSNKWTGISCCTQENLETLPCCLQKFMPSPQSPSCSVLPNATIVAVSLDYNYIGTRLSGVLSESICNLTSLVELNVNNHNLTGAIPACIGDKLLRLRYLGLNAENLSGNIPEQLGNLTSLKELYLDNNALSGTIPASLGHLQSLDVLQLRGNKLSGPIPSELGRLSNLTKLYLQVNLLDGTIPDSFANLTKLQELVLFNNRLSGTLNLSTFQNMSTSLQVLDAHGNSFTGPVPAFDRTYSELRRLDLSFNNLSGEIPASLGRLSTISLLFLGHNSLSGSIPSTFQSLNKTLTALDLSHNRLTGSLKNQPLFGKPTVNYAFNSLDVSDQPLSYFNCLTQQSTPSSCSRSRPGKMSTFAFQAGALTATATGFQADSPLNSTGFSYFGPDESWALEAYGDVAGIRFSGNVTGENAERFQSMRSSSTYLAYHGSNLRPGVYKVILYFAETALPYRAFRVFNVSIQGRVVEQNLDVFSRVGAGIGLPIEKNATVDQNGSLSIEFINTGKDRYLDNQRYPLTYSGPMVSAISVSLLHDSPLSWKWITVTVLVSTLVAVTLAWLGWYRYARLRKLSKLSKFQGLRAYTFKELSNATDGFSERNKLGQGGFGKVYLGIVQGNRIAVKQLMTQTQQSKQSFEKEMEVLRSIQHKNLLALRGYCADTDSLPMLVCDYMQNGSLEKLLYNGKLTWEQRQRIAVNSALGLTYLHEESEVKIVHCDVKPANILLDDEMNPRIGDFGMARLLGEEGKSHVTATRMGGTIGYVAPEYAMHYQISDKVDVYSLGIVLLELVSGRRPLETQDELVLVEWAHNLAAVSAEQLSVLVDPGLEGNWPKEEAIRMAAIAVHCTQEAPSARPGMRAVWLMLSGALDVPALPTSTTLKQSTLKALIAAYARQPSRGTGPSSEESLLSIVPR